MAVEEKSPVRTILALLVLANLLPFIGLEVYEWSLPEALFVYWIDIGLFVVLYTALVPFAQKKPRPEERMIGLVTVPIPFVSGRSGSIQPIRWLPPIWYRNLKYAFGILVFGLAFWFITGDLFLVESDPGLYYDTEGVPPDSIEQSFIAIQRSFTPEALGMITLLFGFRLVITYKQFSSQRWYDRVSAPVLAEIPTRIVVFWFLLTAITTISLIVIVLPLLHDFGIATVSKAWVIVIVVFGKFTMEWAVFQAGRPENSDGLIRWLTPEEIPDKTETDS